MKLSRHDRTGALEHGGDPVQALLARVDDLIQADETRNGAHDRHGVRERLQKQAHSLRRMARPRNMRRVAARADRYVHHNAWKTLGVAVVVGLVAGALSSASALRR